MGTSKMLSKLILIALLGLVARVHATCEKQPDLPSRGDKSPAGIFRLMQEAEKLIKFGQDRELVCFMGISGSGKSTLTLFIGGYEDDLTSEEVTYDEYIINDKCNRTSSADSTFTSYTLVPQGMIDPDSRTTYFDLPGFDDTREDGAFDITSTYLVKKVLDFAEKIKLIFVINYSNVEIGNDRDKFTGLVNHITTLVRNVTKFEDSIALIATKVEYKIDPHPLPNGTFVPVSDEKVIDGIMTFLQSAREYLVKEKDEEGVHVVDIFLKRYNVGIFRKPNAEGPLTSIPLLQENKRNIKMVVDTNISFTAKSKDDFGYTISEKSKNIILTLKEEVVQNTSSVINGLGSLIETRFDSKQASTSDFDELVSFFGKSILINATDFGTIIDFTNFLKEYAKKFDMQINDEDLKVIGDNQVSLDFLLEMSGAGKVDWSKVIVDGLKNTTEYLRNLNSWYNFLKVMFNEFSTYEVQKQRDAKYDKSGISIQIDEFLRDTTAVKEKLSELDKIEPFLKEIGKESLLSIFESLKSMYVTKPQVSFLKKVLDATFKCPAMQISSCEEEVFVAKGHYIFLTQVIDEFQKCPNKRLIQILALEKIFIDTSLNLTTKVDVLSMIAPTWDTSVYQIKITLDGTDAEDKTPEKAHNAERYRENGETGKPGLPGNSAAHFVGIVENLIASEPLTISAKGGEGANGQDGGDSKGGKDDEEAPEYSGNEPNICEKVYSHFECVMEDPVFFGRHSYRILPIYTGGDGDGSNGGDGGQKGEGGRKGQILIADLSSSPSPLLHSISQNGDDGKDGNGGHPGEAGRTGRTLTEEVRNMDLYIVMVFPMGYRIENPMHTRGQPGTQGKNTDGQKKPNIVPLKNPYEVVNNFKVFARENLSNYLRKTTLEQFLQKLDNNSVVKSLYDTSGLLNELFGLESQFYSLRNETNLLPFYQSLLNRTLEHAQNMNSTSAGYKKVLAYLYTTILSKTTNYKGAQARSGMIIAVEKYLRDLNEELEKFQELSNKVVVDKTKSSYKNEIDQKVNEGKTLIDSIVSPETEAIFSKIDDSLYSLIDSIDLEKNKTEEERAEIKRKLNEFKNQMGLRAAFGVLKSAAQLLSFAGPYGELASATIDGSMMVAEPFIIGDGDSSLPALEGLSKGLKKSLAALRDIYKEKLEVLKKQMEDVKSKIEEFQKSDPDYAKIEKSKKSALKIFNVADKILGETDTLYSPNDLSTIRQQQNELIDDLSAQQKELDDETEKQAKRKKFVDNLINIVSLADIPLNVYKQYQNDIKKQGAMADALNQIEAKLKALEQYKTAVYDTIFPMFNNLDKDISETIKNLNGQSRFGLDVSGWRVQGTLKDVQFQIKSLISGDFQVKGDEIEHYVEKLLDGMTVIISMYDRIEAYREQAEFASYIANIYSPEADKISIPDELKNAIDELDCMIKGNQILFRFNAGIEVFKQYIFPFADLFLKEYSLPDSLQFNASKTFIVELVSGAKAKINNLLKTINEWHETIGPYDQYIFQDVWFGDNKNIVPSLMVWKYEVYGKEIEKLLNWEYITLTADIKSGINANAVKFNVLWFQLNSTDPIVDKQLYDELKGCSWEMVHGGNSYYRCDKKYYVTYHEKLNASCYVEPFTQTLPSGANQVYDKIQSNDYILSPFATWSLRLVKNNLSPPSLKKFKGVKFNLELKGRGQYINLDPSFDVCNEDLSKYYTEIDWKI